MKRIWLEMKQTFQSGLGRLRTTKKIEKEENTEV